MTETLRLALLLVLAGAAVTLLAAGLSWWSHPSRNLARLIRKVLGGPPDAQVIAPARNAAIGLSISAGQAVVMWNGGAGALLYPLEALQGAELIVDDVVVARAWRGEPRRALDAVNKTANQVTLRLVFDNPRDPEFILDLWLPDDARRPGARGPGPAIVEARTWLARSEALLRQSPSSAAIARSAPAPSPPPPPPVIAEQEPDIDPDFDGDDAPELPF